jgi:short-subunit dehydrogenase
MLSSGRLVAAHSRKASLQKLIFRGPKDKPRYKMNKKILIIGASSGIGKEIASAYAQSGNIVGITGRKYELLQQLHDEYPKNIIFAKQDIRENKNAEIVSDMIQKLGGLDILIISAGVGYINDDLEWEQEKNTIDINVKGFAEIITIGYHYFKRQKYGHLVGISSIAGIRGMRTCPAYSASKAFVSNYLEALRSKAKKENLKIIVTDIAPGFVDTQMARGDRLFWVAPVEKAARQIIKAIDKKAEVAYITKRWVLIAKILKFLPKIIYEKI